jgi:Flp pilus assembly protein CpaB
VALGEAPERVRNGSAQWDHPPQGRKLGGRRRALPTGRAVVGGLLVAAAAVAVFAAALKGTNQGNAGTYVVAAHSLQAGSVIEPGDLSTVTVHVPRSAAAQMYGSSSGLEGRTLAVPMVRGELLEPSMLVPAGGTQPLRPVTVAVDPAALTGLYTGEPVDVLQTSAGDTSGSVTVVLRGAILFAVSKPGSSILAGPTSASVTLGVSSLQEVESVVAAAHAGTLTIVAASPGDGGGPGPGAAGGSGAGAGGGAAGAAGGGAAGTAGGG